MNRLIEVLGPETFDDDVFIPVKVAVGSNVHLEQGGHLIIMSRETFEAICNRTLSQGGKK